MKTKRLQGFNDFMKDIQKGLINQSTIYSEQDLEIIKSYFTKEDGSCRTPIMLASVYGNLDTVKWLVENGADINSINSRKDNALSYAASSGSPNRFAILDYFFEKGAKEVLREGIIGKACLSLTAFNKGDPALVEYFYNKNTYFPIDYYKSEEFGNFSKVNKRKAEAYQFIKNKVNELDENREQQFKSAIDNFLKAEKLQSSRNFELPTLEPYLENFSISNAADILPPPRDTLLRKRTNSQRETSNHSLGNSPKRARSSSPPR